LLASTISFYRHCTRSAPAVSGVAESQNWAQADAKRGNKASAVVRSAAKERAGDILPVIEAVKAEGRTSLRGIAAALNDKGIRTARGGEWSATQVQRIMQRGK
jgi:hypothetical protein